MSEVIIKNDEVDIVIGALQSDLTSFMEAWRPFFSRFHLIIVKDPDLREELMIPGGFNLHVYEKADIDKVLGTSKGGISFSGYACRYFGYLVSWKKYIISVDDDCIPAKNSNGELVDPISQHIINLQTPATPFFFNTLYDPYCEGADFVRGYPFSLRTGVECGLSCGLWLNLADFDAPTQALKPSLKNTRYVDAVLTVPARAMLPVSGINIAFNVELVGPALTPAFRLAKEGNLRWETVEDIWTGMCEGHMRSLETRSEKWDSVRVEARKRKRDREFEEGMGRREAYGRYGPVFSIVEIVGNECDSGGLCGGDCSGSEGEAGRGESNIRECCGGYGGVAQGVEACSSKVDFRGTYSISFSS